MILRISATLLAMSGVVFSLVLSGGAQTPSRFVLPNNVEPACDQRPAPGKVQCLALFRIDTQGLPVPTPIPLAQVFAQRGRPLPWANRQFNSNLETPPATTPLAGPLVTAEPLDTQYVPQDLWLAYNIASEARQNGVGQTVAIIDAYDDPYAYQDMIAYRAHFHLRDCARDHAPGFVPCFRKVNEYGVDLTQESATAPTPDAGWAREISTDLDMVSAICQNCNILLVEADTNNQSDLDNAVNTAISLGAHVLTNSYGQPTDLSDEDASYDSPGVVIVAASGDNGFAPEVPANFRSVVAVGGTTLTKSNGPPVTYAETVWPGTGAGCSHIPKPWWQDDAQRGCPGRTTNDIAAVADPADPVAVYDTYKTEGTGWIDGGGTSVAAPIIAAMFALAGKVDEQIGAAGIWKDHGAHTNHIFGGGDALVGNMGCYEAYLCLGAQKTDPNHFVYNGPTGWGTPNGLGAFSQSVTPTPSPGSDPGSKPLRKRL